jgi:hypothetical protein
VEYVGQASEAPSGVPDLHLRVQASGGVPALRQVEVRSQGRKWTGPFNGADSPVLITQSATRADLFIEPPWGRGSPPQSCALPAVFEIRLVFTDGMVSDFSAPLC